MDALFANPYLQAVALGIIQGLTEFLPVSSSGHLVVVPYLFGWPSPGLAFDVALHAGTLAAVTGYFAGDVWYLATRSLGLWTVAPGEAARARRTVALLAVGSAPVAVAGLLIADVVEEAFTQPLWVAGFFLVTAALLWTAERVRRRRATALVAAGGSGEHGPALDGAELDPGRDESTVGWVDSVTVGVFQAVALFPGISRSGATIAAGMLRGLSREGAARFSFLLMIPAVAGATLLKMPGLFDVGAQVYSPPQIVAGMVAAALAGLWAIRFLLLLVTTDNLLGFARYLVLLAALVTVGFLWIG